MLLAGYSYKTVRTQGRKSGKNKSMINKFTFQLSTCTKYFVLV